MPILNRVEMNKLVYIATSKQRYDKTLNNFLLHVAIHALKGMYSRLSLSRIFEGPGDLFEIEKVRDIENFTK